MTSFFVLVFAISALGWGHENPGNLAELCVSFLVWQSFCCVCVGGGGAPPVALKLFFKL